MILEFLRTDYNGCKSACFVIRSSISSFLHQKMMFRFMYYVFLWSILWQSTSYRLLCNLRYYGVWLLTRCGTLLKYGYNVHHWSLRLSFLLLCGVAFRAIAFIGMLTFQKKWSPANLNPLFSAQDPLLHRRVLWRRRTVELHTPTQMYVCVRVWFNSSPPL